MQIDNISLMFHPTERRVTPTIACCLMMRFIPMNKLFILFRKQLIVHKKKPLALQQQ